MDYEKKYNEMVRRAKELYESGNALTRQQMEIVCPELSESEDEKIIRLLRELGSLDAAKELYEEFNLSYTDVLYWLEKQKEQKSADKDAAEPTPKQDYSKLNGLERAIHRGFLCAGVENVPVEIIKETAQDCLAQIKPAEWSEEDEKRVKQLIYDTEHIRAEYEKRKKELGESFNDELIKDCDEQIAWLKSLRPQPHWKPSEEQMEVLLNAEDLVRANNYPENAKILASLYEQLKKL